MDGVSPAVRTSRWVLIREQAPLFTDVHRRFWEQCLESEEEGPLFQVTQIVSAETILVVPKLLEAQLVRHFGR